MVKGKCPKCGKNGLRFREAFRTFVCDVCKQEFSKSLEQIEPGIIIDNFGNKYKVENKIDDGKIIIIKTFFLEKGKTTLKGEHDKFISDDKCKFPERLSCNYGEGFSRCEFMKYIDDYWKCILD